MYVAVRMFLRVYVCVNRKERDKGEGALCFQSLKIAEP